MQLKSYIGLHIIVYFVIKSSVVRCILNHKSSPMIQAETDELANSVIKLQTEKGSNSWISWHFISVAIR